MNVLENIFQDLCVENVSEKIRWFANNTPYRIAGSKDESEAANYIVNTLKEYGLEAKKDVFPAFNSYPQYSHMELVSPQHMEIETLPCAHIVSTAIEGDIFELIYVGSGSYADYEGLDAIGKVVLVEVSYSPPVPEKARIAHEKGAAGIVCMNWGNDEQVICNRGLKAVWGNPTEETVHNIPQLIGVSIKRTDGMLLQQICRDNEKVMIRLAAVATADWGAINQPLGILHGNGKSDQFIVVGAHVDAWKPGVTCNATGNASALELCRVLAKYREYLDRDIWFVFWNGHEIAEAAGSTWFVDNYWDQLNRNAVAYINIDSTGLADAVLYEIKSSDELHDFAHRVARQVLPENIDIRMASLPKIGDQSFFGIGIPAAAPRMNYTEEYIRSSHGVTLGWWNHTCEDTYDKYAPDNVFYDLRVISALLYETANARLLPYQFGRKFQIIQDKVEAVKKLNNGKMALDDLSAGLDEAQRKILHIQSRQYQLTGDKEIALYNEFMLSISRLLTNIFQTYANKYQQDSYGHTRLSAPIPLLADLNRLLTLEQNSFAYGMVETQLIKNKNRITDALWQLSKLADLYEQLLF